MKENILELITQALTENRIFDIIQKNEEYQKAKDPPIFRYYPQPGKFLLMRGKVVDSIP